MGIDHGIRVSVGRRLRKPFNATPGHPGCANWGRGDPAQRPAQCPALYRADLCQLGRQRAVLPGLAASFHFQLPFTISVLIKQVFFAGCVSLTRHELTRIESLVTEHIGAELTVYTKEVEQQRAREINTLRAVFGEKYPDTVRVVSVGADIDEML